MKNKIQYITMIGLLIGNAHQMIGMNDSFDAAKNWLLTPSRGTARERSENALFDAIALNNEAGALDVIYYQGGGIDFNARNYDGETFFTAAIQANMPAVIQALIDAGADVNVRDYFGNTPLDYAIQSENPRIVAMLAKVLDLNSIKAGIDLVRSLTTGKTRTVKQNQILQTLISSGLSER